MSETRALHDCVVLIDGPLEGRRYVTEATPRAALDFHAAVGPNGKVLAAEGEAAPVGVPHRRVEYRYAPVMAPDGAQSRGDDGYLRFYFEETRRDR